MFSCQQTQMKFYRASLVLCWCAPRRSAAHWAVNCCFSRVEVTAVVTSYNACQDFASAPIPKISPSCVSWISHDPERPAFVVGPWLFCVRSLPHLSLSHPLQMLQWLFFLQSRPTTPIRGHSATSLFLFEMFPNKAWASSSHSLSLSGGVSLPLNPSGVLGCSAISGPTEPVWVQGKHREEWQAAGSLLPPHVSKAN